MEDEKQTLQSPSRPWEDHRCRPSGCRTKRFGPGSVVCTEPPTELLVGRLESLSPGRSSGVQLVVVVHQLIVVIIVVIVFVAVVAIDRVLVHGALVKLHPLRPVHNVGELEVRPRTGVVRRRRRTPVRVALVRVVRVPRLVLPADQVEVVVAAGRHLRPLRATLRRQQLLRADHLWLSSTLQQRPGGPIERMVTGLHLGACVRAGTGTTQKWQTAVDHTRIHDLITHTPVHSHTA
uniref:Uncharacterized protein n=1 Tax=Anopheles atroparvus TaxID=41427 RepID=A0A182IZI4_ANOAO